MKVIGITQSDSNFHLYTPWIKGQDEEIEIITLSYSKQNLGDIEKCDAVVLTGGIDSHPKFYKNERTNYPLSPTDFNEIRDVFELIVFEYTQQYKLPLLAICRGMQLVNIALGGNLIQDLEEAGKENHRKINDTTDGIHEVFVDKNSLLYNITGLEKGNINSAHHQGLGAIANDLIVSAVSTDDVVEAIEYKDKTEKPFLLGVQWHPERLAINESMFSFSKNIRESFLQSIKK